MSQFYNKKNNFWGIKFKNGIIRQHYAIKVSINFKQSKLA